MATPKHEIMSQDAFEAWFKQFHETVLHGRPLPLSELVESRGPYGDYRDFPFLHGCWEGWKSLGEQLTAAGLLIDPKPSVSVGCGQLEEAVEVAGRVCQGPCYHDLRDALERASGEEASIEPNPLVKGLLHVTAARQRIAACITALEGGRQDEALLSANMALVSLNRRLSSFPSRDAEDA